jgi:predicted dehydrogenase
MKPLRVAIVGCGWVADWHARDGLAHLPELFTLACCCDVDAARARDFAMRHRVPEFLTDYSALLGRPDIDTVILCTPPSLHYEMVLAALAAGKHAICEKPLTSSLALADRIIEAERKSDRRVMPIFQCRFGNGVAKVRHVIRSGLAGRHYVTSVETAKKRGPDYYAVPWRGKFATELGGVLTTQAIHVHDLVFWLIGPPKAVTAFKTTRVNPIEVEDCAVSAVQLADGSLCSLSATLGSARQVTRIRSCFENVTFERTAYDDESAKPGEEPWVIIPKNAEVGHVIERAVTEVAPQKSWFARQYELYYEALGNGAPFPVTLADARASLELITACYHASETGATVQLPIGHDHPKYHGWMPAAADKVRPIAQATAG